jgi:hypothetical protein
VLRMNSVTKFSFRFFAVLVGLSLLGSLVVRAGPQIIWNQVRAVGSGLAVIIVLGGLALLVRTWAWRLTFVCDITALSWSRSFAASLVSEALGQLGLGGKAVGEGIRIALLRPAVPLANAISSGAIDGALHLASSTIVMVSGIIATLLLASLSGKWRVFALAFAIALMTVLTLAIVSYAKRWELMGNAARVLGRIPRFDNWIGGKLSVIDSSEHNLLDFSREAPAAFCGAFLLNFLWQALAVLEVYIILHFMGTNMAVLGAFVMEGLTKLINLVGAFNPGNIGTYEGGNMLMTKLFGVSGTVGLTLALCRRARALFWASIGAVCLMLMSTPNEAGKEDLKSETTTRGRSPMSGEKSGTSRELEITLERGSQC